ncbi:MAG TPA: zinc-binding dehydrogenase, partial [Candidatus Eisenbacteria bacterium]|nr:zinc-binding dehydrogenase [Candidatus Eisenbacteria bacterium]
MNGMSWSNRHCQTLFNYITGLVRDTGLLHLVGLAAGLQIDEFLVVFGASGNTGMMATQLAKKMGAKVIAVSKDNWIKDFGADYIITDYNKVAEQVNELTQGKMADVVLNSLGIQTWENSFESVGLNGRWVTFGGLTGADVKLNVQSLYSKQIRLIGSTGGNRKEFTEL